MSNKVNIKDTNVTVKSSDSVSIGNISNESTPSSIKKSESLVDQAKKAGKLEKVVAIIFIVAVISLIVVLKSI